jgi:hypothetical protein
MSVSSSWIIRFKNGKKEEKLNQRGRRECYIHDGKNRREMKMYHEKMK